MNCGMCLAVLAVAIAPPPVSDSLALDSVLVNPRASWRVPDLAPSVQRHFHPTASQVPPFPEDDPRLMKPQNWPPSMSIDGVRCYLRVRAGGGDSEWEVQSLFDVKPGARCMLSYATGTSWGSTRGPTYCWRGDGTLAERYWKRGNETWDYMYYRSGELFRFSYRAWVGNGNQFQRFEEVFARNGALIGCGFGSGGAGMKGSSAAYWLGREVGLHEFDHRSVDLQIRAFR